MCVSPGLRAAAAVVSLGAASMAATACAFNGETRAAAPRPSIEDARAFLASRQAKRAEPAFADAVYDPWEPLNRRLFAVNEWADRWIAKPLAKAYRAALPDPVERAISRMLANIEEPANAANHLLQLKPASAAINLLRVAINSTLGLAGALDVAEAWGMPARRTDFGASLAAWGVGPGPYLMVPILGPRNLRDFPAPELADGYPLRALASLGRTERYGLAALSGLGTRASLLDTEEQLLTALEGISDKYVFFRDLGTQLRAAELRGASAGAEQPVDDDFGGDDFGDEDFGEPDLLDSGASSEDREAPGFEDGQSGGF